MYVLPVFTQRSVIHRNTQFYLTCLATKHASASILFINNQWFIGFLHKQNWAVFIDEPFCPLMKDYRLLAFQEELKLAKCYYFSVAIRPQVSDLSTFFLHRIFLPPFTRWQSFCEVKELVLFNFFDTLIRYSDAQIRALGRCKSDGFKVYLSSEVLYAK